MYALRAEVYHIVISDARRSKALCIIEYHSFNSMHAWMALQRGTACARSVTACVFCVSVCVGLYACVP